MSLLSLLLLLLVVVDAAADLVYIRQLSNNLLNTAGVQGSLTSTLLWQDTEGETALKTKKRHYLLVDLHTGESFMKCFVGHYSHSNSFCSDELLHIRLALRTSPLLF